MTYITSWLCSPITNDGIDMYSTDVFWDRFSNSTLKTKNIEYQESGDIIKIGTRMINPTTCLLSKMYSSKQSYDNYQTETLSERNIQRSILSFTTTTEHCFDDVEQKSYQKFPKTKAWVTHLRAPALKPGFRPGRRTAPGHVLPGPAPRWRSGRPAPVRPGGNRPRCAAPAPSSRCCRP